MYREVLIADIDRELANIKREIDSLRPKIKRLETEKDPVNFDSHKRAIASCLASTYTGIERTFERIIRVIDGFLPESSQYHQALLERAATEIPGKRLPIIGVNTYQLLQELKGFRHLFSHIYHYNLMPKRLK